MAIRKEFLEKYTNKHSRFIVVDGKMIHYRDEGSGQPLLLVHGAFSSLHTFNEWTNILKNHYRIIRLDIPGFGLSDAPDWKTPFGVDNLVNYLINFLKTLEIEKCHIAGSSLGGWIAWESVLKKPKMFDKLVLLSSAGFMDSRSIPTPFLMARTPFADKIAQFAIKKNLVELFLKQVFVNQKRITDELVDRYYDLFAREGNPEAFFRLVNGKFKDDTLKLKKIKNETLIIWGEQDKWVPMNNAFKFKDSIPNSDLVIYDDLGHIPMEEAPDATAEDILEFLGVVFSY